MLRVNCKPAPGAQIACTALAAPSASGPIAYQHADFSVGGRPTGVIVGDFDRDRHRDVATANDVSAAVAGLEGVHGVMWTIRNTADEVVYQIGCSTETLD